MRHSTWIFGGLFLLVSTAGIATAVRSVPKHIAVTPVPSDARVRDLDITFYESRVKRDPYGAMDLARLGALYLQRARETGNGSDLTLAENAARLSYSHRQSRNGQALQILTTALLSQHRYEEAYETAHSLSERDTSAIGARATLAELALETGRYTVADSLFAMLRGQSHLPSIAPRLARWLEIHGKNEEAHQLLLAARTDAKRQYGMPNEQLAWFDLRVGDIAQRNGRLAEAEEAYQSGLRTNPGDYRLLSALARLSAARRDWKRAISYGEEGIETVLDPVTLGVMGDAWAQQGDSAKAEEYYRVMEVAVLKQPGAFHRAWSLFLLDHGRDVPAVLAKVQEEIQTRRDIYGYDLLAWALHKSGRNEEASAAMAHAMAEGTRDAMLYYHAGMIARSRHQDAEAGHFLESALATNDAFDPFGALSARAVLDSVSRKGR